MQLTNKNKCYVWQTAAAQAAAALIRHKSVQQTIAGEFSEMIHWESRVLKDEVGRQTAESSLNLKQKADKIHEIAGL